MDRIRDPGRVALGCVVDKQPRFAAEVVRLVRSLRWFGGRLAGADCLVCFVESVDRACAAALERLGALIRVVPRVGGRAWPSNRFGFLELPELDAYDTIIMQDCDTVVVQDPWPWLDVEALQVKMADAATVPHDVFQRLFEHFHLPLPRQDHRCTPSGTPSIWYCNAGVVVLPRPLLRDFCARWRRFNNLVIEHLDLLGPQAYHCMQASMALAYAAQPVSFRELPLCMNFPLHLTQYAHSADMVECDPVILHYHSRVDAAGYLQPSPFPIAHERIEQFNQRLRSEGVFPGKTAPASGAAVAALVGGGSIQHRLAVLRDAYRSAQHRIGMRARSMLGRLRFLGLLISRVLPSGRG